MTIINPKSLNYGTVSNNTSNSEYFTIQSDENVRVPVVFDTLSAPFTSTLSNTTFYSMPAFPASSTLYFGENGTICDLNGSYYTTEQGFGYFGTTDGNGRLTVGLGFSFTRFADEEGHYIVDEDSNYIIDEG